MTRQQWLRCKDPATLVDYLGARLTARKYRLFGCACVRGVWEHLPHEALRDAMVTCERFADGLASPKELKAARKAADATYEGMGDIIADHSTIVVAGLCEGEPWFPMGEGSSAGISAVAAEAWSNSSISWDRARTLALEDHCQILRDIVGNPFQPITIDQTWLTSTVKQLAEAIYEERAFDRLPILADALEDAGCTNAEILDHCRGTGQHVRGCWALDAILRKE